MQRLEKADEVAALLHKGRENLESTERRLHEAEIRRTGDGLQSIPSFVHLFGVCAGQGRRGVPVGRHCNQCQLPQP